LDREWTFGWAQRKPSVKRPREPIPEGGVIFGAMVLEVAAGMGFIYLILILVGIPVQGK